MARHKTTSDAVKILHARYIKGRPHRLKSLQSERQKANIAAQIYRLRTKAGLSQKALADLIGTTQSVISRLEDADYNGYGIQTLKRIADVLNCNLEVGLVPCSGKSGRRYAHTA
jgi:ribosome-binding protein aMBF1 (putative translation factor)